MDEEKRKVGRQGRVRRGMEGKMGLGFRVQGLGLRV